MPKVQRPVYNYKRRFAKALIVPVSAGVKLLTNLSPKRDPRNIESFIAEKTNPYFQASRPFDEAWKYATKKVTTFHFETIVFSNTTSQW